MYDDFTITGCFTQLFDHACLFASKILFKKNIVVDNKIDIHYNSFYSTY